MTQATEIFERLKEDHDRHRDLIDKLLPRGAPFGIGSAFSQPYDPTLNGLVVQ